MSDRHTSGPWTAGRVDHDEWGVYFESDRLGPRQTVPDLLVLSLGLTEPNARLIAGAPELLEACRAMVRWHKEPQMLPAMLWEVRAQIDAAIAKATGEVATG